MVGDVVQNAENYWWFQVAKNSRYESDRKHYKQYFWCSNFFLIAMSIALLFNSMIHVLWLGFLLIFTELNVNRLDYRLNKRR